MSLDRLATEDDDFELTAEQAWHLTHLAEGIRLDAKMLRARARDIKLSVESLYQYGADRQLREQKGEHEEQATLDRGGDEAA